MALNNNQERLEWWNQMREQHTQGEIEAAMATLKPETRTVLQLFYEGQLPVHEIAEAISKSVTTVRTYQTRGVYQLSKYFGH